MKFKVTFQELAAIARWVGPSARLGTFEHGVPTGFPLERGVAEQEPELDEAKDVRGNVEDGVAEKRELLDRFNEISARFAEPMSDDEMQALLDEQGEVQDRIDRTDAWSLDRMLDVAMDALRCPPADAPVENLSGGERRRAHP